MAAQEAVVQDENLRLADLRFKAQHGDADAASELKQCLVDRKALPFLQESTLALVRCTCGNSFLRRSRYRSNNSDLIDFNNSPKAHGGGVHSTDILFSFPSRVFRIGPEIHRWNRPWRRRLPSNSRTWTQKLQIKK
jgi:hypothetical protein